jgi:hypothetical protein
MAWTPRGEKLRTCVLDAAAHQGCSDTRIEDVVALADGSWDVQLTATMAGQPIRLLAHVVAFPDDGVPTPAHCVVLV